MTANQNKAAAFRQTTCQAPAKLCYSFRSYPASVGTRVCNSWPKPTKKSVCQESWKDRKLGWRLEGLSLLKARREIHSLRIKEISKSWRWRERAAFSQWAAETGRSRLVVFWKNSKTSARNGYVVLCFDNDILVPVVAQKHQGRINHSTWTEFTGISANKGHWWQSPASTLTPWLFHRPHQPFWWSRETWSLELRSTIFLDRMRLRTATIFECSRKSQADPTSPHPPPPKFFLPRFCSGFFHTSRSVFSDDPSYLHCSYGCCGLGLKRPGFYSVISPRILEVSLYCSDLDIVILRWSSSCHILHILEKAQWIAS